MSDPSSIAFLLKPSALACTSESSVVNSHSTSTETVPMLDTPTAGSVSGSMSGSVSGSVSGSTELASLSEISSATSFSSRRASSVTTADPESIEFVVAHYNEDLSWLQPVMDQCKVYSKGGPMNAPKLLFHVEPLENIGREGHTYLSHIVKYYDSLKDVTLFTQGRVDDHTDLTALEMKEIALNSKPGRVTTFPHRAMELFDLWDGIPWEEYPCWAKWSSPEGMFKGKRALKTPAQYFKQFFNNFGRDGPPKSVGFQPGAIFAVRRESIHQHPKQLYQQMLEELFLGDMKSVDPETGHYSERFWLAAFRHEEYCLWDEIDTPDAELNDQGQLAKGKWHRTPRGVDVDVGFTNKD